MPIVLKSGSLNPLEPSGPVQACNGIALPLPLPYIYGMSYFDVVRNILSYSALEIQLKGSYKSLTIYWPVNWTAVLVMEYQMNAKLSRCCGGTLIEGLTVCGAASE